MAYATLDDVKRYIGTGQTLDDTLLQSDLERAQSTIEKETHRWFEARAATRYYRREDLQFGQESAFRQDLYHEVLNPRGKVLDLDADLLGVTTLTNGDGTVIPSDGYWLEPRNDPPYRAIRLKTAYAWVFSTDGEIAVAGTWGYSEEPPDFIVQATVRLAAYYYRQRDVPTFDVVVDPTMGTLTIPKGLPADVKDLLRDLSPLC